MSTRLFAISCEKCNAQALPAPVVHPESQELERGLERRLVRYAHGHVEVVQEDDELLAAEGPEFVLRTFLHGLLYCGLRNVFRDQRFVMAWFRIKDSAFAIRR